MRRLTSLAAVAVALLLAGCGGSGPAKPDPSLTPPHTHPHTRVSTACPPRATTPACARRSTLPSFVSMAFDTGDVGRSAPFAHMNEDILWPFQTTNGTATADMAASHVSAWVARVHAGGALALMGVGGISDQHWEYACDNGKYKVHGVTPNYQSGFVAKLVNYMVTHGFDGVDLDMEDYLLAAQGPPSPEWTSCAEAIAKAVDAARTKAGKVPILAEEVITNWEGSWLTPYWRDLDQIDLETYGDTCSSATSCPRFASDVSDTANQLCRSGGSCTAAAEHKFMLGLDMTDHPGNVATCGYAAAYAKARGYLGAFDFLLGSDRSGGAFPCQTAIGEIGGLRPTSMR